MGTPASMAATGSARVSAGTNIPLRLASTRKAAEPRRKSPRPSRASHGGGRAAFPITGRRPRPMESTRAPATARRTLPAPRATVRPSSARPRAAMAAPASARAAGVATSGRDTGGERVAQPARPQHGADLGDQRLRALAVWRGIAWPRVGGPQPFVHLPGQWFGGGLRGALGVGSRWGSRGPRRRGPPPARAPRDRAGLRRIEGVGGLLVPGRGLPGGVRAHEQGGERALPAGGAAHGLGQVHLARDQALERVLGLPEQLGRALARAHQEPGDGQGRDDECAEDAHADGEVGNWVGGDWTGAAAALADGTSDMRRRVYHRRGRPGSVVGVVGVARVVIAEPVCYPAVGFFARRDLPLDPVV